MDKFSQVVHNKTEGEGSIYLGVKHLCPHLPKYLEVSRYVQH
jgi:hypothetical protein